MSPDRTVPVQQITKLLLEVVADRPGPILVHSDLRKVSGGASSGGNRSRVLEAHLNHLDCVRDQRELWMPTFNYDFTQTRSFRPFEDESQVGALTEYFRQHGAAWRTEVPVFSIAGTGENPEPRGCRIIDPFGKDSLFAELAEQDGTVLFYGAWINTFTFRHYVERVSGGPLYRYDKIFRGEISKPCGSRTVRLLYHVRPKASIIRYDHERLAQDLRRHDLLAEGRLARFSVAAVSAEGVLNFWKQMLASDPLYLLDPPSRLWVESQLQRIGRRFRIGDFEDVGESSDSDILMG